MAKIQIKSETRHELSFFPNSFDDYVPKDSKVRMVDHIIRSMDINPLMDTYDGIGAPPYSPKMLLSLVVFAYINGVYSCRGIADALKYDVRYMWICGGKQLSFATINRFRSNHMIKCIDFYFDAVVSILVEKGVISLEEQYVDGTKIESKANKYTFVWKKTVEKNRAKLLEKTSAALAQIKEQIRLNGGSDIKEEDSEPATSAKDVERSARLCERQAKNLPKAKLTGREKQKLNTQIDHLFKASDKLCEYEKSLDILGERNSYSKTDPDATFMRLKEDAMNNGQTKPAYNLQIATENQYWTNFALYPNPTDTLTFKPFLDKYKKRYGKQSKSVTADSGYGSEENYEYLEMEEMMGYVKYNWFHKEQHKPFKEDAFNQANFYYNRDDDKNIPTWKTAAQEGAKINAQLINKGLLNKAQGKALQLTIAAKPAATASLINEGFWGINAVQGRTYKLSFWAKGSYKGGLKARLTNAKGDKVYAETALNAKVGKKCSVKQ